MARGPDGIDSRPAPAGGPGGDPVSLQRAIERAFAEHLGPEQSRDPSEILPMLERLQRIALEGSAEARFADRRLAELLLETHTWRAATHVRRLLRDEPNDDASWALMGLAQALLGHHRYAVAAYRKALAIDPGNPWYAHNLGHLLDVALDRPVEARGHLSRAHRRVPDVVPIACSYAHALMRSGGLSEARAVLDPLLARGGSRDPDVWALAAELDRRVARVAAPRGKRGPSRQTSAALEIDALLSLRCELLELDAKTRARARRSLARHAGREPIAPEEIDGLTAAAAVLALEPEYANKLPKRTAERLARRLSIEAGALRGAIRRLGASLVAG
jgi:tetratricopeptide (TPR) repeat protein